MKKEETEMLVLTGKCIVKITTTTTNLAVTALFDLQCGIEGEYPCVKKYLNILSEKQLGIIRNDR